MQKGPRAGKPRGLSVVRGTVSSLPHPPSGQDASRSLAPRNADFYPWDSSTPHIYGCSSGPTPGPFRLSAILGRFLGPGASVRHTFSLIQSARSWKFAPSSFRS